MQRKWENGDCSVACIAMVTGKSYEQVERMFNKKGYIADDGTYFTFHKDMIEVLREFGLVGKRKIFISWKNTACPSIVKINLTKDNFWHWVVYTERNGKKVILDPNPKAPDEISDFRGRKGNGQYIVVSIKC